MTGTTPRPPHRLERLRAWMDDERARWNDVPGVEATPRDEVRRDDCLGPQDAYCCLTDRTR